VVQNYPDTVSAQLYAQGTEAEKQRLLRTMLYNLAQTEYIARQQVAAEATLLDVYPVAQGDTLRKIASAYYGDPTKWQQIATYNNMTGDSVTPGMVILIPIAQ
jgi:LysM repeat protein